MVDFGNPDELRRWLGEQPRQVGIALAARSALRVLPLIGTPSATAGTGPLLLADATHVQTHFRLLSIAWAAFGQSFGDPWIAARARSAAAARLPIGTLFTSSAASTARLSAAAVVRALTTSGQDSIDALVGAIRDAYSAEAEFPDDARSASALAGDVASGRFTSQPRASVAKSSADLVRPEMARLKSFSSKGASGLEDLDHLVR
jgi:hypothetical protein